MQTFPKTVIWRHAKENLKKCSLTGLETREDMRFLTYPKDSFVSIENGCLLSLEGPPLSRNEASCQLILIDATWRRAKKMEAWALAHQNIPKRSIPKGFVTAYPRRQQDCVDPDAGLSSIEALYLAYLILGRNPSGLFASYYWKDVFFERNERLLRAFQ